MTSSNTVQTSGPAPVSLTELIESYMRDYSGRDRTRARCLARWAALLGDRPFIELSDEDLFHP